jgi:hypothetical protein
LTDGTIVYATSTGAKKIGSNLTANLNVSSNKTIYMNWFYIVNGNLTSGTYSWGTGTVYQGNYSLKNFSDDFKNFIGRPEFGGRGSFTMMLIAFLIILISVGAVSVLSGGFNTISVGLVVVAETWLFYWLGMIPLGAGSAVPGLIPWAVSLLFIAYIIWESVR